MSEKGDEFDRTVWYIGGLAGPQIVEYTKNIIEMQRSVVAEYGYNLRDIDPERGPSVRSIIDYGNETVGPAMRNMTENDVVVVMSAGRQIFLYQYLVLKVPCKANICFVETTNGGLPWIAIKLMNILNVFTHGDHVDSESAFCKDLRPNSRVNREITANLGLFGPDVQVVGNFTGMFGRFRIGPWNVGNFEIGPFDPLGVAAMFEPLPDTKTIVFPSGHKELLSHEALIRQMFAAAGIKKLENVSV